jgi:hypothetical protein
VTSIAHELICVKHKVPVPYLFGKTPMDSLIAAVSAVFPWLRDLSERIPF